MYRIVVNVWIPITISYVKITCYDNCIVQVNNILAEKVESSLIAIRINVDHKVYVMVIMECQNIDIPVVDNIKS